MNKPINNVLEKLERFIEKDDWSGWDPYDGLNSEFLKTLTLNRKWLRIAVIQFMKRSPLNLRPLFGIVKSRNPKALGLLASAYIIRYKQTKREEFLNKTRQILDWLIANSSDYSGFSWGYNFNWQSAVFYIPKGIPTVVNTSFIANAFLDAYEIFGEKDYLSVARSACDFILHDLNRTHLQSEISNLKSALCFSYSPVDNACVHNANLLAAELLARVYSISKEEQLIEYSDRAVKYTMLHQNDDGSWHYGLAPWQKYIDSFHTGFVLVSLLNYVRYTNTVDKPKWRKMIMKGYEYYKVTLFDDGLPHYFHNNAYPIDLHCSAQGIITFLKFRKYDNKAVTAAERIARWAIENMWDTQRGYFYFQKTKYFLNKVPYLRWPNVWMYYALSLLHTI